LPPSQSLPVRGPRTRPVDDQHRDEAPSLLLDEGAHKGERPGRCAGVDDRNPHVVTACDGSRIQLVPGQRQSWKDDNARLRRTYDTSVRLDVPGNV